MDIEDRISKQDTSDNLSQMADHQPLPTQSSREEIDEIITQYLVNQLDRRGYVWQLGVERRRNAPATWNAAGDNHQNSNRSTTVNRNRLTDEQRQQVIDSLCRLSNDLRTGFGDNIDVMCVKFDSYGHNEGQDGLDRDTFRGIGDELFSEGIKWGHIITFLVFGEELAFRNGVVHAHMDMIDHIRQYLTQYFVDYLSTWIADHNGWLGVVEYARSFPRLRLAMDDQLDGAGVSMFNSPLVKYSLMVGAISVAAAVVVISLCQR